MTRCHSVTQSLTKITALSAGDRWRHLMTFWFIYGKRNHIWFSVLLSVCLFVGLSGSQSVSLSVCLSVCLELYIQKSTDLSKGVIHHCYISNRRGGSKIESQTGSTSTYKHTHTHRHTHTHTHTHTHIKFYCQISLHGIVNLPIFTNMRCVMIPIYI